jgi:hypothetical protein
MDFLFAKRFCFRTVLPENAMRHFCPRDDQAGAGRNFMTASNIHLVGHPLIQHKLTLMRERDRPRAFGNR